MTLPDWLRNRRHPSRPDPGPAIRQQFAEIRRRRDRIFLRIGAAVVLLLMVLAVLLISEERP